MADLKKRSKILIHVGGNILLSSKKEPGNETRDRKLEMPGGTHEAGESPAEALLRELQEEEISGLLAHHATTDAHPLAEIVIGDASHFLFEMSVDSDIVPKLKPGSESYGFETLDGKIVTSNEKLNYYKDQLTPKTFALFSALIDRQLL